MLLRIICVPSVSCNRAPQSSALTLSGDDVKLKQMRAGFSVGAVGWCVCRYCFAVIEKKAKNRYIYTPLKCAMGFRIFRSTHTQVKTSNQSCFIFALYARVHTVRHVTARRSFVGGGGGLQPSDLRVILFAFNSALQQFAHITSVNNSNVPDISTVDWVTTNQHVTHEWPLLSDQRVKCN